MCAGQGNMWDLSQNKSPWESGPSCPPSPCSICQQWQIKNRAAPASRSHLSRAAGPGGQGPHMLSPGKCRQYLTTHFFFLLWEGKVGLKYKVNILLGISQSDLIQSHIPQSKNNLLNGFQFITSLWSQKSTGRQAAPTSRQPPPTPFPCRTHCTFGLLFF